MKDESLSPCRPLCLPRPRPASHAVTTLKYVGNAFTNTAAGPGNFQILIEFNTPLTPLTVFNESHIASFTATSAGRTITNLDLPSFFDAEFTLGANLLPTSWGIAIEKNIEAGGDVEQWSSFVAPNSVHINAQVFDAFSINDAAPNSGAAFGNPFSVVNNNPGVWTIVATPEPASAALLLLAAATLSPRRRPRNH